MRRPLSRRRAGRRRTPLPNALGWVATIVGGAISLFFLWQLVSPTIVPRDEGGKALLVLSETSGACTDVADRTPSGAPQRVGIRLVGHCRDPCGCLAIRVDLGGRRDVGGGSLLAVHYRYRLAVGARAVDSPEQVEKDA
jgi:hypothetical protein